MTQGSVRDRAHVRYGRFGVMLVVLGLGTALAGCAGVGDLATGTLAPAADAAASTSRKTAKAASGRLAALARAHKDRPADALAAIAYARALKASGDAKGARGVLDGMEKREADQALLVERGLLALELGDVKTARKALASAAAKDGKNWRVLSALGVVEASSGKAAKARGYFKQALQLAPDNPVVLNNMAMAYLLQGKASEAEIVLRNVAKSDAGGLGEAKSRVERNLALAANLTAKPAAAKTAATAAGSASATEKPVRAN